MIVKYLKNLSLKIFTLFNSTQEFYLKFEAKFLLLKAYWLLFTNLNTETITRHFYNLKTDNKSKFITQKISHNSLTFHFNVNLHDALYLPLLIKFHSVVLSFRIHHVNKFLYELLCLIRALYQKRRNTANRLSVLKLYHLQTLTVADIESNQILYFFGS